MNVRVQDHLGKQRLRNSWPVYSLELEWIRADGLFEFKQRREAMVASVMRVIESRKSSTSLQCFTRKAVSRKRIRTDIERI